MKKLLCLIFSTVTMIVVAQPDTEIYVFDLNKNDNSYEIKNPVNITYQNPGYDNQPHFKPDGGLYYVSTRDGQTDVAETEFHEGTWSWLTDTPGSEYSPTPIPGESGFSAINLESDGRQLLWKYTFYDAPEILVEDLKIGYHCWFNQDLVVAFVLGEPVTMQVCNVKTGKNRIVGEHIGRS
ncbi:MAG: hypothetical protein R3345_09415, partial [Fulvivirga sp.]|nr:hypothetical protein [Fulvivirga sp.]